MSNEPIYSSLTSKPILSQTTWDLRCTWYPWLHPDFEGTLEEVPPEWFSWDSEGAAGGNSLGSHGCGPNGYVYFGIYNGGYSNPPYTTYQHIVDTCGPCNAANDQVACNPQAYCTE